MNRRFRFAKLVRRGWRTTLARYAPFWEEMRLRAFFGMDTVPARKLAEDRRACRFYEHYGERAFGKEARDAWERRLYGDAC